MEAIAPFPVKCINAGPSRKEVEQTHLTEGKNYMVVMKDDTMYMVQNDLGDPYRYYQTRFQIIERSNQT